MGGTPVDAQTGEAVGQNAVENNSVGISYSAWKKDQALMKENPAARLFAITNRTTPSY